MIKQARNAGFSIADLRLFVRLIEQADPGSFDADAFLRAKIEQVEDTIGRSGVFLKTLRAARRALDPGVR